MSESAAQQNDQVNARRVAGCWRMEAGPFSTVGARASDPGQTMLPSVIRLEMVPGKSWTGEPLGRRVYALADPSGSRYREGYYRFGGRDSLHVEWTNGVVGMTLTLRVDTLVMRGRASAWTDYGGEERAPILLRRVSCPARNLGAD